MLPKIVPLSAGKPIVCGIRVVVELDDSEARPHLKTFITATDGNVSLP